MLCALLWKSGASGSDDLMVAVKIAANAAAKSCLGMGMK